MILYGPLIGLVSGCLVGWIIWRLAPPWLQGE